MTRQPPRTLARLRDAARGACVLDDVMIVAAHPDDEVIGASSLLRALRPAAPDAPAIVHTTDGAPRDMDDARRAGFATRDAYARARQVELLRAIDLAGVPSARALTLAHVDKEAALALVELTGDLASLFRRARPSIVLTHPYEGGHPDHDATAFAVRHAALRLARDGGFAPDIFEFTSYHERDGELRNDSFLAHEDAGAICDVELDDPARDLKRRMFACFASQSTVLENFHAHRERFRRAPRYDFTRPPHPGRLHYETFGWDWTGERFRALAAAAKRELEAAARVTQN